MASILSGCILLPLAAVGVATYTCGPPGTVAVTVTTSGESFRFSINGREMRQFGRDVFLPTGTYELLAASDKRMVRDVVTVETGEQYLSVHDDGSILIHR